MTSVDADAILARAKSVLAREILDAECGPAQVGDIRLHEHQRRAVARIRALLATAGGALLADSTGLGKTFVALAVAMGVERVLIVGPATLAESWYLAMARARVEAHFVSLERLSRSPSSPVADAELVIVDEAHHLRNQRTKSYAAVAALCDRARVLLLSATPLQNRRDDLVAQLALFLGDAAASATDAELARFIVRRRADGPSAFRRSMARSHLRPTIFSTTCSRHHATPDARGAAGTCLCSPCASGAGARAAVAARFAAALRSRYGRALRKPAAGPAGSRR